MSAVKVIEWVDIGAPRSEVFDIVLNIHKRMQLSPLYGTTALVDVSSDYPNEGSRYRMKVKQGEDTHYDSIVTAFTPLSKFAYNLTVNCQTKVTWLFQDVSKGTRVIYEEEFLAEEVKDEEITQTVRKVVREWLKNIKLYAELREGPVHKLLKWAVDRFYFKMRYDQRRVVLTLLFMQVVGLISFVMAAIALGIAWALFS